jgi:hypothetical protein
MDYNNGVNYNNIKLDEKYIVDKIKINESLDFDELQLEYEKQLNQIKNTINYFETIKKEIQKMRDEHYLNKDIKKNDKSYIFINCIKVEPYIKEQPLNLYKICVSAQNNDPCYTLNCNYPKNVKLCKQFQFENQKYSSNSISRSLHSRLTQFKYSKFLKLDDDIINQFEIIYNKSRTNEVNDIFKFINMLNFESNKKSINKSCENVNKKKYIDLILDKLNNEIYNKNNNQILLTNIYKNNIICNLIRDTINTNNNRRLISIFNYINDAINNKYGYVYIMNIPNTNIYKIGFVKDALYTRYNDINNANIGEIKIILLIKSDFPNLLENILHVHFNNFKIKENHEWFNLNEDMLKKIINAYEIYKKEENDNNIIRINKFMDLLK